MKNLFITTFLIGASLSAQTTVRKEWSGGKKLFYFDDKVEIWVLICMIERHLFRHNQK